LNFIAVKGPELVSKYVGESEYKIREVFRKARAAAPSVIFFDEIDSIAPTRGSGSHEGLNVVATLLNEMDGVEDVKQVLVLAATNRPEAIDPALLRPGRLGTTLYIGPPNKEAIKQILTMHTHQKHPMEDLGLEELAENMVANERICYSGADVNALCRAAAIRCARDMCSYPTTVTGLRKEDLICALKDDIKPSLSKDSVDHLKAWTMAGLGRIELND
jgi:SpoVK/Ycf46/Vps4 family AAA+-type ATPase